MEGIDRRTIFDIGGILAIPFVLAMVQFFVSPVLQDQLAFEHARFRIYTLFTYAFVHASDAHLYGNLIGYFLATAYTYLLCLEADARAWFRRTFVIILLVVPVATALTSFLIISSEVPSVSPTERGFSGVVAGFGGFLLVALAFYLRERYNGTLGFVVGATVLLVLLVEVDTIYGGGVGPAVIGIAIFGIVFMLGSYVWEHGHGWKPDDRGWALVYRVVMSGLVVLVLSLLVVLMFPRDVFGGSGFTNIFAHAAGFVYGMSAAAVTLVFDRWSSV